MILREWLELPHRFCWGGIGGDDCLMFCASWVHHVRGFDPAAEYRGAYETEEQAVALIRKAGGMLALVGRIGERSGLARTDNPANGDIALIAARSAADMQIKEIGAIKFGHQWACLGYQGVAGCRAEFIAAWSVMP
ncbi:DUF6950 family protein [Rhizobium sp. SYY.PMSO]|uniref:DUF6950 family protein n=1 Tax=Rhizobium sp. SYY.PMSO TaxID=3382192 RepID=UPI00398FA3AE